MLRFHLLLRRRLSTSPFDPAAWTSKYSAAMKPATIRNVLQEFSLLSANDQLHALQISPESVRRSLQLLAMLQNQASPTDIFHHIASHADSQLFAGLVEQFLMRLLAEDNLNAVVSLVHVVKNANNKHYMLSNQFWSVLASNATALAHHAACSLVYHEIINPYEVYFRNGTATAENELIPFLLLPSTISQLAIVLAQHGNVAAIEGLRAYFRRFYSYFGHRSTYETLTLARVEAWAASGDLSASLDAFVDLCLKYRGHTKYRDPKDIAHSLKYLSYQGFKERKRNIINNIGIGHTSTGRAHKRELKPKGIRLFQPNIQYNIYHRDGMPHWAILDGCVRVADLPVFHELLKETTQKLVSERYSVVDRLLALISRYHHSLHKFVVVGLCQLGHLEVAWAVMSKLPDIYPRVPQRILYSGPEVFTSLFRALRKAFEGKTSSESRTVQDLNGALSLLSSVCRKLNITNYSCRKSYLEASLATPAVSKDSIEAILREWKLQRLQKIALDAQSNSRLISLGVDQSYVSEPCSIRL